MTMTGAERGAVSDEQGKRRQETELATKQYEEQPTDQPTLLWRIPANAVTLATGTTMISIKAGVSAAKWGLHFGRKATYGILGLNQTIIETILRAAGQDVSSQSLVALRQQETAHLVDKWIYSLHAALSAASVLAASGFFMAENTLNWTSESSLLGLHFLNSIFGSTDASRAVAAIIQIMKIELNKPDADGAEYQVATFELLTTIASFLFLQRNGRRKTELEWRNAGGDATVWDIVIDDRGFRADVIGTRRLDAITTSNTIVHSPIAEESEDFGAIVSRVEGEVLSNPVILSAQDQHTLSDEEIRQRIMEQLPAAARATITSETMTVKTIKVDIQGSETTNIEPPPGMIMVSEHPNFDNSMGVQTVIFRTASKVASLARVGKPEQQQLSPLEHNEAEDADDGGMMMPETIRQHLLGPTPPCDTNNGQGPSQSHVNARVDSASGQHYISGPVANQKKVRKAVQETAHPPEPRRTRSSQAASRKERQMDSSRNEKDAKPGMIKKALKSLSPTQSSAALNRVMPGSSRNRSGSGSGFGNSLSETLRPLTLARGGSRKPVFEMPVTQPTTPLISPVRITTPHEAQAGGYFTIHEQRRESTYSQTDTYSVHSNESGPPSPSMSRTHLRASNSISKTHSHTEIAMRQSYDDDTEQRSHHRRSKSFVPSLYSMGTKDSGEDTLVLAPKTPMPRKSIFEDNKMLMTLAKEGHVPGQFPRRHLIWALRRFGRFASAVYGKNFLSFMGMAPKRDESELSRLQTVVRREVHHEHASFSHYTGLPDETIIKSSYLEPRGIKSKSRADGFAPIIHIVTVDFEAKAIVMTCRGTLGFEDLLTDMACDYADMYWQGHAYKAHRGIRDSARRLMDSRGGNSLMEDLRRALQEYPEFGLVFVGHSLGGAVAALLAIMLSEPSKHEPGEADAPAFVTAVRPKLIPSTAHAATSRDVPPVSLPAGRPIHVYAFGTPACISEELRIATRGLITTVINANDIVPYLSLGTLHDLKAIARRLKQDFSGKLSNIRQRASERILTAFWHFFTRSADSEATAGPPPAHNLAGDALGEDTWMWTELVEMRSIMTSEKLVPPGEIFTLESTRVFDRNMDETTSSGIEGSRAMNPLGRGATRVQLKYVKDVEKRFREIRFTRSMFREHAPWCYENNISALERGVYDEA